MKLGFIGCGNMVSAIVQGILANGLVSAEDMIGSNSSEASCMRTKEKLGIQVTTDNKTVAKEAQMIFLGVKPYQYEMVIKEIRDVMSEEQIVVSIAPGKTFAWFEEVFGKTCKVIRTVPNTPALVGEGMTGICGNALVTADELRMMEQLFQSFGRTEILTESLLDVVATVGGSSPAFVYMLIEAMADAAVMEGLTRKQAYTVAAQAVLGGAKMVLETGMHPGALKDQVCSPGGSTIQGVRCLEERGFRSAMMEALATSVAKARTL